MTDEEYSRCSEKFQMIYRALDDLKTYARMLEHDLEEYHWQEQFPEGSITCLEGWEPPVDIAALDQGSSIEDDNGFFREFRRIDKDSNGLFRETRELVHICHKDEVARKTSQLPEDYGCCGSGNRHYANPAFLDGGSGGGFP